MNKRKILLFVLAGLLLLIILGWVFFLFRGGETSPTDNGTALPTTTSRPGASQPPRTTSTPVTFEKVSDKWILAPRIQDNTILGFDLADSKLKAYSLILKTSQEKPLSKTTFAGISAAAWSPTNTQVLFKYRDEKKRQTLLSIFDLRQSLNYALDGFTKEAAWSPDGTQLVIYKELPHKNSFYLATIKPDGSNEQKLIEVRVSAPNLLWTASDTLVFYSKPVPQQATEKVFTYSLKNKILAEMHIPIYRSSPAQGISGLTLLASPDGKRFLVTYSSDDNRALFSAVYDTEKEIDPSKEQTADLALIKLPFSTLTSKCAWATNGENLYCAYFSSLPEGNYLWPFAYWMGKVSPQDSFARFNWKTGELKTYSENTPYDAEGLDLAKNESFLTFINRKDLNLYRLKF